MNIFYPVILSGGTGTRLWPLSRASLPKQLLSLTEEKTMLQATVVRAKELPGAQSPIIVCNNDHRFMIKDQLELIGVHDAKIVLEPMGKNTAPAVAIAALELAEQDPNSVMLVLSADHVIRDTTAFNQCVEKAINSAKQGYLVTFGILPKAPETGYGYIKSGNQILINDQPSSGVYVISKFVEKPDRQTAEAYLAEGGYTWNSGMFVFTANRFLEELEAHRPDILAGAKAAWDARKTDLGFVRLDTEVFAKCPSESIDYAVMQDTKHAAVVPGEFGWSDVGAWDALWEIQSKDDQGNVIHGDAYIKNCKNSYVRAEHRVVALIGLDDVVVVETRDAVLVAHRDKAQDVKNIVQQLEKNKRKEHLEHTRMHRPWGWYEGIDRGERFQVKRIMVKPGGQLSLQMHHHRAEHWVVVSGTAKVTINNQVQMLSENQSTYIPIGQTHRLENPGCIPLHLIEVQSGSYLGEDDIVRFSDTYGR